MSELKWSLVIATYNRPDSLRECLRFAIAQTRPPSEIIVIDASDNFESNRQTILGDVRPRASANIKWRYEKAANRSSTHQRNQGIKLATGDILFLIDDDSYMHSTCAEAVMSIYESDTRCQVAGVGILETTISPGAVGDTGDNPEPLCSPSIKQKITDIFERELWADRLLLPYDGTYPDRPVPQELYALNVTSTRYINGFRMTFRSSVIREVGFDENLRRYAMGEDMDASYLVSRRGALVDAINARVFHAKAPEQRLSRYTTTLLGHINLAYLYRKKGRNPRQLLAQFRLRLLRRLVFDLIRDVGSNRFSLPYVRADVRAFFKLNALVACAEDDFLPWFHSFQETTIRDDSKARLARIGR
jgi:GT2 family glycosyltransferase